MIVWLPIPSHPGYEASSDGRVRNAVTGRVLRQRPTVKGYLQVDLGSRAKGVLVHRLVCEAFFGTSPTGERYCTDHVDFDRTNNAWWNLRWLPGHLNDFRWRPAEPEPEDHVPMTEEEVAAWEETMRIAGW